MSKIWVFVLLILAVIVGAFIAYKQTSLLL